MAQQLNNNRNISSSVLLEKLQQPNVNEPSRSFNGRRTNNLNFFNYSTNSYSPRPSILPNQQELNLNKQAKKLFDIGQGGISLPGLSYLSTKLNTPTQKRDSFNIASRLSTQKPLNETSQDVLNKFFPFFQQTNVNDFDNRIDFFVKIEDKNIMEEEHTNQKLKNQMKVKFSSKRRKENQVIDFNQIQGNSAFIQPQFMQQRGSMCITELWPDSMKKELVNSHTQSHKKVHPEKNQRLQNMDNSFMSVFRPNKQNNNLDAQNNAKDNKSNMTLSKFGEKNEIKVINLKNQSNMNRNLNDSRSFLISSPVLPQKSVQQQPQNADNNIIDNNKDNTHLQIIQSNINIKSPKSNFYNHFVFPENESKTPQNQLKQLNLKTVNVKQLPSTPFKLNKQNNSLYGLGRIQNNRNNHNMNVNNSNNNQSQFQQQLMEQNYKLDLLKNDCEEQLENNIELEKSINTNLKQMNTKLQNLISKLS